MPLCSRSITAILTAATLLIFSTPSNAVIRTVALDGSQDFTVIQDAVEASTDGDSVLVYPGTYSWTNQGSGNEYGLIRYWRDERDGVHLVSVGGPDVTILDAEGQGRVFFCNGNNVASDPVDFLIKGFTFRNGYATKVENRTEQEGGGAALHLCDATFEDCNFENNVAEIGGGVWMGGVGVYEFRNCRFEGNRAERLKQVEYQPFGGAVCVFGPEAPGYRDSALFEGCTFVRNHSDYRGAGLFTSQDYVTVRDCLFAENTCNSGANRSGTAIYGFNPHELIIEGVTVRDHDSIPGAAVLLRDYTSPDIRVFTMARLLSTVVYRGTGSGHNLVVEGINDLDISCTDLFGATTDWLGAELAPFKSAQGNINVDPLFCSDWGDRRMVSPASPLLAEHNSCQTDIGRIVGMQCGNVRLDDPDTGDGKLPSVAQGLRLLGASPNPFNPRTSLRFELAEAAHVRLDVYDARGRHVATVVDARRGPGLHEEVFDGRSLGSGVYHLRMEAGDQVRTESMVLVR
jgi:hypothetical protein